MAEQCPGDEALLFTLRAGHWCDRAGQRTFSGLAAIQVQKRRDEAAELRRSHHASQPDSQRPIGQPLNAWSDVFD